MTKRSEETIVPELLAQMRQIYSRYTGYEVAAVIAEIRRELNAQASLAQIEADIASLKLALDKMEQQL
mgnify:FL=1